MGGIGSDIAVGASDAVLVSDNIKRVPYLVELSQRAMRRINGNIMFAAVWNMIAVSLSIIDAVGPVGAALVYNVGSVVEVMSSALLMTNKDERPVGRGDSLRPIPRHFFDDPPLPHHRGRQTSSAGQLA